MKPVYLEFCGINSFSEPAKINFNELLEFGIFGIFGDTGAGKSTILDCISLALYGEVTRIGGRSSSLTDLINYRSDKAYVVFEFEIAYEGRRRYYRAERELKRKGAGHSARLYEKTESGMVATAEGVRDCRAEIEKIVGLEQKDFEKCIALPQGEFAQFVKAARGDRVKLIARLFDLERYGEGFVKRAGARYAEAKGRQMQAETRLQPYAEISEARNKELSAEVKRLEREDAACKAALAAAREEETRLKLLFERRAEKERLTAKKTALDERLSEMAELQAALSRLERAAEVTAAARTAETEEGRLTEAQSALKKATERADIAEAEFAQASQWNAEEADEEISKLTERVTLARLAGERRERRARLEADLQNVVLEQRTEAELFKDFDYEGCKEEIAARIAALGTGDFYAFVEEHGKAFLRGEYAVFAAELAELEHKYPVIGADSAPLIEKYQALSEGEKVDFATLREAYGERERAGEQAREELLRLERQKSSYDVHIQRLARLGTDFARIKEELAGLGADEPTEDIDSLTRTLEECKRERRERSELRNRAAEEHSNARIALASATERCDGAKAALEGAKERLNAALAAGKFACVDEAKELSRRLGDPALAKTKLEKYREECSAVAGRLAELTEDYSAATEEALATSKARSIECARAAEDCTRALALAGAELRRGEESLVVKRELEKELAAIKAEAELYERLKKLLEGNKFMEFVAEEYLQTVAVNASGRLLSLTDGRYFLRYEGGFFVGDNFNGGALRGVHTLSGGETFLVSLSLALALSAEICARSMRPIEFFFLDEGFGTLDERLVDTVMDSLEKLKGEHFSIGIISHVEELKHRIERKLLVRKATERQGSQIITE